MKKSESSAGAVKCKRFAVGGISLSPDVEEGRACDVVATELSRAGINPARLRFDIYKRSVDARKKKDVRLVYSVAVSSESEIDLSRLSGIKRQITPIRDEEPQWSFGSERTEHSPLVVGMGPAGLFCALALAENGYRPVIIDRGDGVLERCKKTEVFFGEGELDPESNVQFGAGGAGTFSDGKLVTRVGDARVNYILRRFCDFGAPEDITVSAKPHIGTDLLVGVVERMLCRIEELGGRVIYRCRLESFEERTDGSIRAVTSRGELLCSGLVMATGHSARDIYTLLMNEQFAVEAKPFSLGVRIEHLQSDIDKALLGDFAGHPRLGRGEYHLSDTTTGRGVYTFCMCPGGEVVAATSEEGGVVVNGMSNYRRDGVNSNCAVAVSVFESDYGATVDGAINFQRHLERTAYNAGGGEYAAPVCVLGDFFEKRGSTSPTRVKPTYMEGTNFRLCDFSAFTPDFIYNSLRDGIAAFDKKLRGFASPTAVLSAFETRTSAPVRIIRNESRNAPCHDNLFPCGEGAGYAGGITSAAVDGLKTALEIMSRFAPLN